LASFNRGLVDLQQHRLQQATWQRYMQQQQQQAAAAVRRLALAAALRA
jgi:hypothetical protein